MKKLLITAGPTQEPIDAVRYVGNRSSGQLGIAIANAAIDSGIETTLLLGPIENGDRVSIDSQVDVIRFRSTHDLQQLLSQEWQQHDTLIMTAAVADYSPVSYRFANETVETHVGGDESKIKRSRVAEGGGAQLIITLEATADLVAACAACKRDDQRIVGFALEPADRLEESARAKLVRKELDAIVANPLETMGSSEIDGFLIWADGRVERARDGAISKEEFARWLVGRML